MSNVVLVTGDRYAGEEWVPVIEYMFRIERPDIIIQGGARGIDWLSRCIAIELGVIQIEYAADWEAYGKRAGPQRNIEMIERLNEFRARGDRASVWAFHADLGKSKGTKHMVKVAREHGYTPMIVDTLEVPDAN